MTVLKFVRIFSGGNQKTNTITKLSFFFFVMEKMKTLSLLWSVIYTPRF